MAEYTVSVDQMTAQIMRAFNEAVTGADDDLNQAVIAESLPINRQRYSDSMRHGSKLPTLAKWLAHWNEQRSATLALHVEQTWDADGSRSYKFRLTGSPLQGAPSVDISGEGAD